MSAPTRPAPRRRAPAGIGAVLALVLGSAAGACSGDGDEGPGSPSDPSSSGASASSPPTAPAVETKATVRKVTGTLAEGARTKLQVKITEVVDAWIDAAYVGGDYPRSDFDDAFASFTPQARVRAEQDTRSMSNAQIGEQLDGVEVFARQIEIDALAADGRASAVSVAVRLGLGLTGEIERRERITGHLYLTYTADGWQVFGYDIERGEV